MLWIVSITGMILGVVGLYWSLRTTSNDLADHYGSGAAYTDEGDQS